MECKSSLGIIFFILVEIFFLLGSLSLTYKKRENEALACIAFGAIFHCLIVVLPSPGNCRKGACGSRLDDGNYVAGKYLSDIFSIVTVISCSVAAIFDIERDIPVMTYIIVLIADIFQGGIKNVNQRKNAFYEEHSQKEFLIDDSNENEDLEADLNLKRPV